MGSQGSSKAISYVLVGVLVALVSATGITGILSYLAISGLQRDLDALQLKYDSLSTGTQGENLTVESYTSRIFERLAIQLNLKNIGTTNIEIIDVKVNGYSNQTLSDYPDWLTQAYSAYPDVFTNPGWNGTTYLQSNQTGPLYVYIIPCYLDAIEESIPHWSYVPTKEDLENFENSLQSYGLNFTITTSTGHQYSFTDPQNSVFLLMVWTGALTFPFNFMATEQGQITHLRFDATHIYATFNNTGTTPITFNEAWVNNVKQANFAPSLPYTVSGNNGTEFTVTYTVTNGYQYDVRLVTSKGNTFTRTGTAAGVREVAESFTVKAGQVETRTLSLTLEDHVQIRFTVTGQASNVLDFYITDSHGNVMQEFGVISAVNYAFICSQEGNYTLHFSNVASAEDKLVTLDYEVTSHI